MIVGLYGHFFEEDDQLRLSLERRNSPVGWEQ